MLEHGKHRFRKRGSRPGQSHESYRRLSAPATSVFGAWLPRSPEPVTAKVTVKAENWERSLSNPDQLGQRVFSCQNTLSALPCLASSRDAPSILSAEATDWLRSAQVTLLDYAREGARQDQTPRVEDCASNLFPAVFRRSTGGFHCSLTALPSQGPHMAVTCRTTAFPEVSFIFGAPHVGWNYQCRHTDASDSTDAYGRSR